MRSRGRLQRDGDGIAGTQSGGSVQLLLSKIQPEDGPAAGRPDGEDALYSPLYFLLSESKVEAADPLTPRVSIARDSSALAHFGRLPAADGALP